MLNFYQTYLVLVLRNLKKINYTKKINKSMYMPLKHNIHCNLPVNIFENSRHA